MMKLFGLLILLTALCCSGQVQVSGSFSGSTVAVAGPVTSNVTVFPSSATVEQTTVVPFSATNGTSNTATWALLSGSGSLDANGNYTAPASNTTAVIQATIAGQTKTATISVTGTTPTLAGDCSIANNYPHRGNGTMNTCHMTHTEFSGTATRNWEVVIPTNYVAGQSPLIMVIGGAGHGLTATNGNPCGPPTSEVSGWATYISTVPSPAPVVACLEGDFNTVSTERWNYVGILDSPTWLDGSVPNDCDFERQTALTLVRDLSLNPKAVFAAMDWMGDSYAAAMAVQCAVKNSDIFAALGSYNDSNLPGLNASFISSYVGGLNTGQTLSPPAVPISVIMEPGVSTLAGQAAGRSAICGTNLANTNKWYHPLTTDDTFRFFNLTNKTTSDSYSPSGVGTSFCAGTFDGNGNGQPSLLMTRKSTGGVLGTEIFAYRFKGNGTGAPWCTFAWDGGDTLGCGNATTGSRIALDLRNATCNFTKPCNSFLDAGTGPASASGYSPLDIMKKFFDNHKKP